MTLDPRWSVFLSIFLAILGVFAGAGSQFTDLGLQPTQVKAILALCVLGMAIGNAINAVLGAIPSKSDEQSKAAFYLGPKTTPPTGDGK